MWCVKNAISGVFPLWSSLTDHYASVENCYEVFSKWIISLKFHQSIRA